MPRPQVGFTLIEIMISFAVLAIALTAFCSSLASASQVQSGNAAQSQVLEAMEKVIEDIETANYGQYSTTAFDVAGVLPAPPSKSVGAITITPHGTDYITYTITATWMDPSAALPAANSTSQLIGKRTYSITYVHVNRGG